MQRAAIAIFVLTLTFASFPTATGFSSSVPEVDAARPMELAAREVDGAGTDNAPARAELVPSDREALEPLSDEPTPDITGSTDNADNADNAPVAVQRASMDDICAAVETAAATNELPVKFFVRLLWRESRFRPDARSPVGALGIAQFMPRVAVWRGLADPFDPIASVQESAEFLRDLRKQFGGNLGLAAAAYNGGSGRVERWLKGRGGLPRETREYVRNITGAAVENWRGPDPSSIELVGIPAKVPCPAMASLVEEVPLPVQKAIALAPAQKAAQPEPTSAREPIQVSGRRWIRVSARQTIQITARNTLRVLARPTMQASARLALQIGKQSAPPSVRKDVPAQRHSRFARVADKRSDKRARTKEEGRQRTAGLAVGRQKAGGKTRIASRAPAPSPKPSSRKTASARRGSA